MRRHPKNAPGPFFVENGTCMSCGTPEMVAPDLIAHDEGEGEYHHCYFKRQPETHEEKSQAVDAWGVSCCGQVKYEGDDPEVLQLMDDFYGGTIPLVEKQKEDKDPL